MTRKKAIEAAMKRLRAISEAATVRDEHGGVRYEGKPTPGDVQGEMEAIGNEARIAGLREAARIAERNPSHPEWIIDDKADALAKMAKMANPKKPKKARGK